jgi:diketogulonate reductase-like aldo/keto reductase
MDEKIYAVIPAGTVEYSKNDADVEIQELIDALEQAKEDGATHVVGLSGNYRGAQYVRLGRVEIEDLDYFGLED